MGGESIIKNNFPRRLMLAALLTVALTPVPGAANPSLAESPRAQDSTDTREAPRPAPELPGEKKGWPWADRQPLALLELDFSKNRITNLTGHGSTPLKLVDEESDPAAGQESLIFGQYGAGFRVVSLSRLAIGTGPQRQVALGGGNQLASVGLVGFVGLVPVVGSDVISVKYVDTLEQARRIEEQVQLPETVQAFASWRSGDSMLIGQRGGIAFLSGIGPSGVGVASLAVARGEWSTRIEKIASDQLYVKISKGFLTDYAVVIGTALVAAGISQFDNQDDSFSFLINTSHGDADANYQFLIRGELAEVQRRAAAGMFGVSQVDAERMTQTGTFRTFFLGIPLLWNTQWSHGHIDTFTATQTVSGVRYHVNYGVFSRAQRYTSFRARRGRLQGFIAARFESPDIPSGGRGVFGRFFWEFADNNSNHWQLRQALKELVRQTGVKQLAVRVPDHDAYDYVQVRFEVTLSQSVTAHLLGLSARVSLAELNSYATKLAQDYASGLGEDWDPSRDPLDLCPNYGWDVPRCRDGLLRSTRSAAKVMWHALKKMSMYRHSPKELVQAYAEFGEAMSENVFMFRTALHLINSSVDSEVEVSGTHIAKYNRSFRIGPDGNRLP